MKSSNLWRFSTYLILFSLFFFPLQLNASEQTLDESLRLAGEISPQLSDEYSRVLEHERELDKTTAGLQWQLDFEGSYHHQRIELEFEYEDEIFDEFEPDAEQFEVGFVGRRSYLSGLNIGGTIEFSDNDPFDTDNLYDNLELLLNFSYNIWPRSPGEISRSLILLQDNLELAQMELFQARQKLYIDLIEDYLDIIFLQKELDILKQQREIVQKRQSLTDKKAQINEAGKLELMEIELALRQVERSLRMLEQSLESSREVFIHKLGAEEPAYDLDDPLLHFLLNREFKYEDYTLEEMLNLARNNSLEYQNLKYALSAEKREKEWWEEEAQPEVNLTGSRQVQDESWQIALNLNYSLYDGGLSSLEREEFEEEIEGHERNLSEFEFSLEQELVQDVEGIEVFEMDIQEAEIELERARLNYLQQKKAYKKGAVDALEFEESLLTVEEKKIALSRLEFEKIMKGFMIDQKLGFSWIEEEIFDVQN